MEDSEDIATRFSGVNYLPGVAATSSQFYSSRPADPQHYFSHHHYHYQPSTHHPTTTHPAPVDNHQHVLHNTSNNINTNAATSQQHSSSSLSQHQAHHNFWSDISGGGSSIPSSLLATSSSSLSSSTGLPVSSNKNFERIETPLTVANSLLDVQYNLESRVRSQKLRPRPESCVTTRSDILPRPEQDNRPKSSCGSLTVSNSNHSSPDKTLLAPPDLDETISANNVLDTRDDLFGDLRSYVQRDGSCRQQSPSRLCSEPQPRLPQYQHRHPHHLHFHTAAVDSIISQSLFTANGRATTSQNIGDFNASTNLNNVKTVINSSISSNNFGNLGTPPPPLPPKPKLGVPARGPPPRPPSRQLPLSGLNFGSTLPPSAEFLPRDDTENCRTDSIAYVNSNDQDSISFV